MPEIKFVDTTLRDGKQSLWANRLSTSMMLAVMGDIDAAGFESIEFGSGPGIRAIQVLDEDPSAWIRLGPRFAKRTPLRHHGGLGKRTFGESAYWLRELKFREVVEQGITLTRTSEPWNNMDRFGDWVHGLDAIGMQTVVSVIYSISPRHTDEYFVQKTTEAAAIPAYRICFKDVGGILTPERARVLLPKVVAAAGDIPVEFHGHCSTGMGAACLLIAAESGIHVLHTGIPPLAEGNAQPSIFAAVRNLNELGFDTAIDLKPLHSASEKLTEIARRHGFPIGAPAELDYSQFKHQVPGGMSSHLMFQLQQVGQESRLPEALVETARVRAELGYPIMVTPLAQFVGSQAAINVITGQRYTSVTDEIIRYAMGVYGDEAIEVMDPGLRDQVLTSDRAAQLRDEIGAAEETLEQARARYGGLSDHELSYVVPFGIEALPFLRRDTEVSPYDFTSSPEARWLRDLPKQAGESRLIELKHGEVSMRVGLRS